MLKKYLCLALAVLVVSLLSLSTTYAASSVDYSSDISSDQQLNSLSDDRQLIFISEENSEYVPFDDIRISIPIPASEPTTIVPQASYDAEVFVLSGGLKKTKNGVFTWEYDLDCVTSLIFKPVIALTVSLEASFTTENGSYSTHYTDETQNYNLPTDYAVSHSFTTAARTGYYRYRYRIDTNGDLNFMYRVTNINLFNRTGHVWTASYSCVVKTLPKPRADYVKGQLYPRPSNLANDYYEWYYLRTGLRCDTSLYEVHHIQPLSYGGNNSYANLIHLPKEIHRVVTGWFSGY